MVLCHLLTIISYDIPPKVVIIRNKAFSYTIIGFTYTHTKYYSQFNIVHYSLLKIYYQFGGFQILVDLLNSLWGFEFATGCCIQEGSVSSVVAG